MKVKQKLNRLLYRRKRMDVPTGGTGMDNPAAQPQCVCSARGCVNHIEHWNVFFGGK